MIWRIREVQNIQIHITDVNRAVFYPPLTPPYPLWEIAERKEMFVFGFPVWEEGGEEDFVVRQKYTSPPLSFWAI
jgi:hypothetical protein